MAVYGAEILEAQLLKEHAGDYQVFERLLCLPGEFQHRASEFGDMLQKGLGLLTELVIEMAGHYAVQVGREASNILGYGHLVIVQDNYQVSI